MPHVLVLIYSTLFGASAQGQILTLNMATSWSTAGPELRLYRQSLSQYGPRIGTHLTSHAIDVIYDVACLTELGPSAQRMFPRPNMDIGLAQPQLWRHRKLAVHRRAR